MFTHLNIIAQTERNICLSLKRYWLLVASIYLLAITVYVLNSALFINYSAFSTSVELVAPNTALMSLAQVCMVVFTIVATLLAIEVRARDSRERMSEVLDTRPLSNSSFVLGRFVGIFLVTWLPVALLPLVLQLVTWVMPLFGLTVASPLSVQAVTAFVLYVSVPTMAFCIAATMFFAVLTKNRLLAAAMTLGLVFLSMSFAESKPYVLAMSSDLFGISQLHLGSDIDASVAPGFWWLQRVGILFMAMGLLALTVLVYPRLDAGSRLTRSCTALALLAGGGVAQVAAYHMQQQQFNQSYAVAKTTPSQTSRADIESITARVDIEPSQGLSVRANLRLTNTSSHPLSELMFTLNPGFKPPSVTLRDGTLLPSSHDKGLLSVTLDKALLPQQKLTLTLSYQGMPDTNFAYLDSAIRLNERNKYDGSYKLKELGYKKAILNQNFVAMMPGIHWLPASGKVAAGTDKDFFNLELQVTLPSKWLVAGPGKREVASQDDARTTYRFAPQVAVPEVAVIAGEFNSYKTSVKGIEFEMLIAPQHSSTVDAIAVAEEPMKQWLAEKLSALSELGLDYPYRAFSVVEVPNTLRSYQGGWRMNTAMAPPAMALIKENGFPTARFDVDGSDNAFSDLMGWSPDADQTTDLSLRMRNQLINYIDNDFGSSNLFTAFARSIYDHQLGATGQGKAALDYFLSKLTNLLITGKSHYFSVENDLLMEKVLDSLLKDADAASQAIDDRIVEIFTSKPSVWDLALASSLRQFNPSAEPTKALDMIELKAGRLAKLFYDKLGPAGAGQFLADLLAAYRGQGIGLAQVQNLEAVQNAQLDSLLETWFAQAQLPGFKVVDAELYQLAGSELANVNYQLSVHLQNSQSVAGYVKVSWQTEQGGPRFYSEPMLIEAKGIANYGLVLSEPPVAVYVDPYLSLNRKEFQVASFDKFAIPVKDAEAHHGIRYLPQVDSSKQRVTRIVADDLDADFAIEESQPSNQLLAWLKPEKAQFKELDQGLPLSRRFLRYWSRKVSDNAWGHYRHTFVGIKAGQGETTARLSSDLPQDGQWRLEVHLPQLKLQPLPKLGKWNMQVISHDQVENIQFDAGTAVNGWNHVNVFELNSGPVEVVFSNKSDGKVVIVDAVSWTKTNRG